MARGDIRIGISGWRYEPWRGTFYPKGLAQRRELEYASRRLSTIEINGSFYSLQTPDSYRMWREATPDGFVFAVKGGRYITHMLRLRNVRAALGNFFASGIAELREKVGPFLWQFPPNFAYDAERIENFLAMLPYDTDAAAAVARRHDQKLKTRASCVYRPPGKLRHAMEVRHPSFLDPGFIALLRKYNVSFVVADTAGKVGRARRRHGGLRVHPAARRGRAVSQQVQRGGARAIRLSRGLLGARARAGGCRAHRASGAEGREPRRVLLLRQHGQGARAGQRDCACRGGEVIHLAALGG
jgi:uncharacterized protein YecE (DUF72 family)